MTPLVVFDFSLELLEDIIPPGFDQFSAKVGLVDMVVEFENIFLGEFFADHDFPDSLNVLNELGTFD